MQIPDSQDWSHFVTLLLYRMTLGHLEKTKKFERGERVVAAWDV